MVHWQRLSGSLVVGLLEDLQHHAAKVSSRTLKIPPLCVSGLQTCFFFCSGSLFSGWCHKPAVAWPCRCPLASCRVPTSAQLYTWNPADLSRKRLSCSSFCQSPCHRTAAVPHSPVSSFKYGWFVETSFFICLFKVFFLYNSDRENWLALNMVKIVIQAWFIYFFFWQFCRFDALKPSFFKWNEMLIKF